MVEGTLNNLPGTDHSTPSTAAARATRQEKHTLRIAFIVGVSALLVGCTTVPIEQQRLVSKPSMLFSETRAFGEPTRMASQLEPGRVITGGAQASACTSCR